MTSASKPPLPFWPFLLVDVIFLALAYFLLNSVPHPLTFGNAALVVVCVAAGAITFLTPFMRRADAQEKLAESQSLTTAVSQIQKLEQLAGQIANATAQWQGVQETAAQTADLARQTAENMACEAKMFTEFLQKANDNEKAHLRVEVDKLRRNEGEWLQILTRILDHVFALAQAANASGQPRLIEQITQFQNSCRDVARRAGLVPFLAKSGEPLDPNLHQLLEDQPPPGANALIAETLATGYTFQGQLIRRALVTVHAELELKPKEKAPAAQAAQEDAQPSLI